MCWEILQWRAYMHMWIRHSVRGTNALSSEQVFPNSYLSEITDQRYWRRSFASFPPGFPHPITYSLLIPRTSLTRNPETRSTNRLFAQLQRCRAAKLLDPVDEEHMYFAAMHKTGCQLTALGKHYWRLAQSGRI